MALDLKDRKNISKYLNKINNVFRNQEKKSISEILDDFRYMSSDYESLNSIENKYNYSNYNFDLCTDEEKENFINDQLQLIEVLVTNKIYEKVGTVWNWNEIYNLMHDPSYKDIEKGQRKVVFPTSYSDRPIGEVAYNMWNGLQIIDIDIKNKDIATGLKPLIFEELKKYHWFLGVCLSASGKSLHVWTKITPLSNEFASRRVEFRCNFRQKYSYIYIVLLKYSTKFGYTKDNIFAYMDNAMAKPQQGIFISSDSGLMNTNFIDLRLDATFEIAFDTGVESIDWISHPDLKRIFNKLEWFDNDTFSDSNIEIEDLENIENRDTSKSAVGRHYKHAQRWQLANTLTYLFGKEKALSLMIEICKETDVKELKGDVKTASIHKKPISKWAIDELNKRYGFNIKIKENPEEEAKKEEENKEKLLALNQSKGVDPIAPLNTNTNKIILNIRSDQWLSDIKDDIIKNLAHITLLEAGAGYGKTEMIKSLKAKTLLILPFTSTIKAKIEASETTKDWLYFYGKERPTFNDLADPGRSMTMTIDKFSHLNLMELDTAEFEYIVIDESHLLFTSSYRDVMSPAIQRLANCKAKVIMMTGTPTAEVLFFPDIKHIKVKKEETRIKKFTVYKCHSDAEQLVKMIEMMAEDIMNGIKILYPTNKGNLYFEQIVSLIQRKLPKSRELKAFYYKKSNYGDDSMEDINRNKTIGENDIIFCSTYLSVGVDIEDKSRFSVYFNELWNAQDIEQFANRLRRNDLYIKLFIPKTTNDGIPINWNLVQPLDLNLDKSEIILARDLIKTCNDMLDRNNEESRYNPLIQSILIANKYLKYDEIECKYYIDETNYKLRVFEERYSEYAKQLKVAESNMIYYGYEIDEVDYPEIIPLENVEALRNDLKSIKNIHHDKYTKEVYDFLEHINDDNIDLYRELLHGNYALFRDDEFKEQRGNNNLYVKSIEVMERNLPIILTLYKFYTIDTIKDIYKFCTDNRTNKINFAKLKRIQRFAIIQYNREIKKLDFPIIKFVRDAQNYANENPVVTQNDINIWIANYAIAYANSIEDLVVQDTAYIDEVFDICKNLWSVVIIQSRPSNQKIIIKPFELTWERKDLLENIYGDANTKEFLLQELEDDMKKVENIEDDEDIKEFEKKKKVKIEDIESEIPEIIHNNYEYKVYSSLDKSNERFIRKQENTKNTLLIEDIKDELNNKKENKTKIKEDNDLTLDF